MKILAVFFLPGGLVSPRICVLSYAKTDLEYGKKNNLLSGFHHV